MKKLFIAALFFFSTLITYAQSDTSRVEQYCQVIVTPRLLSNKVTIDIDFGEEKSFWRDTRLKSDGGRVRKFNTVIDALNYMGKEGWAFINAYPVRMGDSEIYHFAFKKQFQKTELQ